MMALLTKNGPRKGRKTGTTRSVSIVLVLTLALPASMSAITASPAAAQERYERRNLLDMIFGVGRPPPERYERRRMRPREDSIIDMAPRRQRQRNAVPASAPRAVPTPVPAKPEPIAKLENARTILVIGDFIASGIGDGLKVAFENSPGVVIDERGDGSSGLVREDHFDWPAQLPRMLNEAKPAAVVIMLGANDRQQMQIGSTGEKFRTEAWFNEYEARVAKLAGIVTAKKLPLLWVGLPSFASPSLMADAATLNTIYRAQVEKAGGEFVDVWDGFVDEEGKFVVTGSDMNGQQARLRGADGITFTPSGKRKLAFYVEKFARRHLGEMASPELVRLDASNLPELLSLPPTANMIPTQPISLSDPELDGGAELLGASPQPMSAVETPRDMLVRRGELPPAPTGRIDDYRVSTQ